MGPYAHEIKINHTSCKKAPAKPTRLLKMYKTSFLTFIHLSPLSSDRDNLDFDAFPFRDLEDDGNLLAIRVLDH